MSDLNSPWKPAAPGLWAPLIGTAHSHQHNRGPQGCKTQLGEQRDDGCSTQLGGLQALPGWLCLGGALEPLPFTGAGRAGGVAWEQVEQCCGSCCCAGLLSAPKGPCTHSAGPRPGECRSPGVSAPQGQTLHCQHQLRHGPGGGSGPCARLSGTFLRFPGQRQGPGLLPVSHAQRLLRASLSS